MKFVIRLMSDDDRLMGWAEVHASAQSNTEMSRAEFRAPNDQTRFRIDAPGTATYITVHWTDFDVRRKANMVAALVVPPEAVGKEAIYAWIEPLWCVNGQKIDVLPPVTVGSNQSILVPLGVIGAVPGQPGG